jgi:signal transduction histidine kinase
VDDTTLRQVERARADRRRIAAELDAKLVELDASQVQLMHAQKLQTVGTMASGLAHELNNILTPIRGLSELLVVGVGSEQSRRYGQRILDAAVAAAQITGSLLTYTRQGTFAPVRSDLGELLKQQILPVLGQALPSEIRLETRLAPHVSADVDRVLFQQAITNLVLNAVDAMPTGGTLTVDLSRHADRPEPPPASPPRSPAPEGSANDPRREPRDDLRRTAETHEVEWFARIEVRDTGAGIPPEHLGRVFEPFFTTKRVGSGQGLGLPAVQGIVERHGGRIEVVSIVGEGSTFSIFLPMPEVVDTGSSPTWPALKRREGAAVVLVVSEDSDTRDELEDLVSGMPCAPITADDPRAARGLLTELGDRVDLLLLDFDLTSTDPAALLRTVRSLHPTLPIVLLMDEPSRGGAIVDDHAGATATGAGGPPSRGLVRVLRKPIDQRLAQALITDVLNVEGARPRRPTPVV